jgi:hypothetical protein
MFYYVMPLSGKVARRTATAWYAPKSGCRASANGSLAISSTLAFASRSIPQSADGILRLAGPTLEPLAGSRTAPVCRDRGNLVSTSSGN